MIINNFKLKNLYQQVVPRSNRDGAPLIYVSLCLSKSDVYIRHRADICHEAQFIFDKLEQGLI